jgi:galactose mutarotase-like enzyme
LLEELKGAINMAIMKNFIEINDKSYSVQINPFGAELSSFKDNETGQEFIWQRDESWWKRSAPILFPIIGVMKNSSYLLDGNTVPMTKHGFARDCDFSLVEKTKTTAIFKLVQTEETKKMFPFSYSFLCKFSLEANNLSVDYIVENTGDSKMPVSLGSHPALNLFLDDDISHEDYEIKFSGDTSHYYLLENDLLNLEKPINELGIKNRTLNLTSNTFDNDALIFNNLSFSEIELKCSKAKHHVRMSFRNANYFGIWSPPAAPFVCLEPWAGVNDTIDHDGDIWNKHASLTLEAGKRLEAGYSLELL